MADRDVTRALAIVAELEASTNNVGALLAELRQILTDIDARTGKRDPSKRSAKKAGRR